MRKRIYGTVISLLACASIAPAATRHAVSKAAASASALKRPAVFYDFKGARLGMSLAEWRALPMQATAFDFPGSGIVKGAVRPICSGDPGAGDVIRLSFRTKAEEQANVIVCGYAFPQTIGTYTSWDMGSIPIGEMSASDVEYKFLDDKLYEISITGNSGLLGEVMSGLQAKWGEPTISVSDTTQNKAGATFPHTVKTWINTAAQIRVETPYSRIDDLNVTYATGEGLQKIMAIEKALNPDTNKM